MKTPESTVIDHQNIAEETTARLVAIVQSSIDAIISKTLEGIITSWNPAAERLFGYTPQEMIGQSITKLIPPDRILEETEIISRIKKGERVEHFDTIRVDKYGKLIDISLTISPIKDSSGRIIGASKIARDITAQKQLNHALQVSESRLRLATEAGNLGTWEWSPITGLLIWDQRCKQMFGILDEREITFDQFLDAIHPDDRDRTHKKIMDAIKPDRESDYDTEYRIIGLDDNAQRWIRARGKIFDNEPGFASRFTGTLQDITRDKEATQTLNEKEERLRMAIEATSLGTWDYKPMTGQLRWSDECRRIYNMPDDIVIDFDVFDEHLHPEDKSIALNAINSAMDPAGNGSYDVEYRILTYKDKFVRWIRAQGQVYFNDHQQPEIFIGTVLDITDHKQKEQELIDSITLFQDMADTVPVMIWITEPEGHCLYLNRTWYEFTGQGPENSLGYGWLDVVHPDDSEKAKQLFLQSNSRHEPFNIVFRLQTNDGHFKWVMNSGKPKFNFNGQFEGMIGTCIEIDERVRAEDALKESEERLNMAVEAAKLGTWEINYENYGLQYSKRYLEIFGYSENDKPDYAEVLKRIHPDDMGARDLAVKSALESGMLDMELRIQFPDNSVRWIVTKGIVVYKNGKQHRMLGTVQDITTQKNSFQALQDIRQSLQENEERLLLALDATDMGTWSIDLETGLAVTSDKHREIMGYEPTDRLYRDDYLLYMHPGDRAMADKLYEKGIREGTYQFEARLFRPGKPMSWIKVHGKTIYDEQGMPKTILGTVMDITDEKNAASMIEENENRLRIAIESAQLGTWEYDPRTDTILCSERTVELFGFEEGEKINLKKAIDIIVSEDRERVINALHWALNPDSGGNYDIEYSLLNNLDRQVRTIKARGKAFFDSKGEVYRFIGTALDITEQINAFGAIQESEERFRTIANTAPVMIWMSGSDHFTDFFNTSWLSFTGRSLAEERGEGWRESVYPDDVDYCVKMYNEAFEEQRPFYSEYRLRRYDGEYRWVSDNAVPRYTPDGKFIGFISACMDIDDEKRFNEKLQASELLFKTITNVSPVGLWMTDKEDNNTFVNDTWVEWTGLDKEKHLLHGWLYPALEADRESIIKQFNFRKLTRQSFSSEFRFKRTDGQVRWGLTEGYPYFDEKGSFAGYAGSVTDITERKQNEMLKNDFLTVASHELKTPLTSVKAYSQLLKRKYESSDDDFLKNALMKMENQVTKMSKLVADFLNLSKIESDKFQLHRESFLLNELVEEIVGDIRLLYVNNNFIIGQNAHVWVDADREKIAQVITNFLNNAVKYSPEDRDIRLALKAEDGMATIEVIDNGIGIKAGEHEKIFQRFYRSEFNNNISFSGFGIGLYISAEIVNRHNGKIGVHSDEGKGSKFYFSLPIVA